MSPDWDGPTVWEDRDYDYWIFDGEGRGWSLGAMRWYPETITRASAEKAYGPLVQVENPAALDLPLRPNRDLPPWPPDGAP